LLSDSYIDVDSKALIQFISFMTCRRAIFLTSNVPRSPIATTLPNLNSTLNFSTVEMSVVKSKVSPGQTLINMGHSFPLVNRL